MSRPTRQGLLFDDGLWLTPAAVETRIEERRQEAWPRRVSIGELAKSGVHWSGSKARLQSVIDDMKQLIDAPLGSIVQIRVFSVGFPKDAWYVIRGKENGAAELHAMSRAALRKRAWQPTAQTIPRVARVFAGGDELVPHVLLEGKGLGSGNLLWVDGFPTSIRVPGRRTGSLYPGQEKHTQWGIGLDYDRQQPYRALLAKRGVA